MAFFRNSSYDIILISMLSVIFCGPVLRMIGCLGEQHDVVTKADNLVGYAIAICTDVPEGIENPSIWMEGHGLILEPTGGEHCVIFQEFTAGHLQFYRVAPTYKGLDELRIHYFNEVEMSDNQQPQVLVLKPNSDGSFFFRVFPVDEKPTIMISRAKPGYPPIIPIVIETGPDFP